MNEDMKTQIAECSLLLDLRYTRDAILSQGYARAAVDAAIIARSERASIASRDRRGNPAVAEAFEEIGG